MRPLTLSIVGLLSFMVYDERKTNNAILGKIDVSIRKRDPWQLISYYS